MKPTVNPAWRKQPMPLVPSASSRPLWTLARRTMARSIAGAVLAAALTTSGPAFAQPKIKQGGTLVVAINDNPPNLMSGISTDIATGAVTGQIYDTLVSLTTDLKLEPSLATSWARSDDGLSYTFRLRPGVTWHDGKPFTSADVKYSFEQVSGKYNSMAMSAFQGIAGIDTPDDLTVIIRMKGPDPAFFPWGLAQPSGQIFAKHIYEGTDPTNNPNNYAPIGTGPFRFKEWVRGSHITVERNPDYFDKEHVYLDRVVFQVMPEASARQLALERGDVDHLPYVALPAAAVEPLANFPETEIVDLPRPPQGEIIMFFNLRNEPLSKKEVRHAIAYGIDRDLLVALALNGRGKVATGPISSANTFYDGDVRKFPRDVAQANKLLDAAGFPAAGGGMRFSLRLLYQGAGEGGSLQAAAEIMREQLREIGIDLKLQPSDAASYQDNAFIKWNYDMAMGSFQTGPDPKIGVARMYLSEFIVPRNASNLMGYSNPKVDELFKQAAFEVNEEKRTALYHEAQKLMVEDLPALWLWEKTYPVANRKGLVGLPPGAQHTEGYVGVGWTE